ncbi:hypothetical protein GGI43DRAFT_1482 [Trichoderma evansii]
MQAAKPRARARSSMQVDTLDTRNAVKVRSTDPSSERIHAESKGAQATTARTALAFGLESSRRPDPGLAWQRIQREAIPGPARCGPSAIQGREEKFSERRRATRKKGDRGRPLIGAGWYWVRGPRADLGLVARIAPWGHSSPATAANCVRGRARVQVPASTLPRWANHSAKMARLLLRVLVRSRQTLSSHDVCKY